VEDAGGDVSFGVRMRGESAHARLIEGEEIRKETILVHRLLLLLGFCGEGGEGST